MLSLKWMLQLYVYKNTTQIVMFILLKLYLWCVWLCILCQAVETDSFAKLDTLETSMKALKEKLEGLKTYVLEIERNLDRQNKVNEIFRRQMVNLSEENIKMKRRLSFMESKCVIVNKEISTVNEVVYGGNKLEDARTTNTGEATRQGVDSFNMNEDLTPILFEIQEKGVETVVSKVVEHPVVTGIQSDVQTKASTFRQYKQHKRHRNHSKDIIPSMNRAKHRRSKSFQGRQLTEPNESVAFSTFLQKDMSGLTRGQIIKFDGVLLNDGNGYDVTTGIFTAPRSGLYLFSYAIEDYSDQLLWVYLRHDNQIRSSAVAKPYAEHQNVMGSNTLLLKVDAGSKVWISVYNGNRVQNDWTTFSGVLLH